MSNASPAGGLDLALQRLGNAVMCVSSREYPHVVADGTLALREVELGIKALRTALRPFANLAAVLQADALAALVPSLASERMAFKIPIDFGAGEASFTIGDVRRAADVLGAGGLEP